MNSTALRHLACGAIFSTFLLSVSTSTRADALDHWTTNQVDDWYGLTQVAYGNGRFVAGGQYADYGEFLSSEDGLKWTLGIGGWTSRLQGICYLVFSGDRFIFAAGPYLGNSAGFSTNGINWTYGPAPYLGEYNLLRAIGYFSHYRAYVLAYDSGGNENTSTFYYSLDGTTWRPALVQIEGGGMPRNALDVAYGAGLPERFVAVARDGFLYNGDLDFWYGWPVAGGGGASGDSVTFAAKRFFVPFTAGMNLISNDGYNWAWVGTGLTNKLGKIGYANGLFYARAGDYLATSNDGTSWLQRTLLPGNGGVAFNGRRFVNVGRIQRIPGYSWYGFVYTSDDLVELNITNWPPQISLSGKVGRSYRIESLSSLPASVTNPWQTLTNLVLPSSPYLLSDPEAPNSTQRYYRAVLLP